MGGHHDDLARLTNVLICAIGLMLAVPAAAQTELPQPDGPWTYPPLEIVFPDSFGELERVRIVSYDDAGTNVSVGYDGGDPNGSFLLTLYVYPNTAESCAEEFADTVSHIENYLGSSLLSQGMATAPDGKRPASARHSGYIIPAGAMREGVPQMVSDAYLYCSPDDQWRVKCRVSWSGSEETFPDGVQLISGITWPGALLETDCRPLR